MKNVFMALDTNKDGKLSREELLEGFVKHMATKEAEEEVEKIMK